MNDVRGSATTSTGGRRWGRAPQRLTTALVAGALLAGCQSATSTTGPDGSASNDTSTTSTTSTTSAAPRPAELSITPSDEASGVRPDEQVVVQAGSGTLESVRVVDEAGEAVAGSLSGDEWRSSPARRLRPATTYTVTAEATGADGVTTSTTTATFATIRPKVTATYGINYAGMTVGTGMPVAVQFDSAVTDPAYRQAVERAVTITTTPKVEGHWGWLDNRQLMWRPKERWQPGTSISVTTPFTGLQTGPGKWVSNDDSAGMAIGRSQSAMVDTRTHRMVVRRGGQVIRTIKVSTGRPGPKTETRSGTKVIIGKDPAMTMDSETVGIAKGEPGYYKIKTKWNVRVTWTGEFLHSAPWSVGAQGNTNVSHGCVNMAPADAKWMFENSLVGDVVDFRGSKRVFQPDEGIGVWQYDYADWVARSELA
ncbi:Ig-like domain-containing protein [Janibacter sp. G56]|uniref:L,D-transpeptidase n=1 Tax=Janibacter sp. G56 TaxID=3418717 RepID=UPI003D0189FF